MNNVDEVIQVISIGLVVAGFLLNTNRYLKAIELYKECLFILKDTAGLKDKKISKSFCKRIYFTMWKACSIINDNTNAIRYAEKILQIHRESGDRLEECKLSIDLAGMYLDQSKYDQAERIYKKAMLTSREIGHRQAEACCYRHLGIIYRSIGEYVKAREHLQKSLAIMKEIRDRNGEANCYGNLGNVYHSVGEYEKAKEHVQKSLAIMKEVGDRNGEANCYTNLGNVSQSVGEYEKAKEHLQKSLAIKKEVEDRNGEASCYGNLGNVYQSVGEYEKAKEHIQKSLAIIKEVGNRNGEASCYANLGNVYHSVGEYEKAKEHLQKSLAITKEVEDRNGEANCYGNLGNVYQSVGEYEKAKEHLQKSLAIMKEVGDRNGEANCYKSLGTVYQSVGEYEEAREHYEKSLAIKIEIGDRNGEATCYANLGSLYGLVGEHEKASDYFQKSSAMSSEIGTRAPLAASYRNLAGTFCKFRNYRKANDYNKKALAILTDIGDKHGLGNAYMVQGDVEYAVGAHIKGKEYFEKGLAISKEIGNRPLEATGCLRLGQFFFQKTQYATAQKYIKRGLKLIEETGDLQREFYLLEMMAQLRLREEKIQEAISYFQSAIGKCEEIRDSLRDNDQFKVSFSDDNIHAYRQLSSLLCETGIPEEALYVSELTRARALADLMYARYSAENKMSDNPRRSAAIEGIVVKECKSTCLYVSYFLDSIYLWILKGSGATHVQLKKANDLIACEGLSQRLEQFFNFRSIGVLPEGLCEDGSLHDFQPVSTKSCEEDSHEGWRTTEERKDKRGPEKNLSICYKLIIAPVADLLEGPEIIIVPDRALYSIPFAALTDKSGKYFSETFRIRVVPSLTTLKLINESPADYHCQTGALIVGNPDVGEVHFKGRLTTFTPLPFAEKEARMVGEKLGVEPLLGEQATKQAVLEAMNSVALIHIGAHGDAERGAIALAPSFRHPNGIPQEGLYLLTMSDISNLQLRAKLVVLSCCHSARGLTKAEGVVGIARAFLGSGARSVLVALWALDDEATEQLMRQFYDHLVAGESAGESLHEAMKWMRSMGYEVKKWAPFILIGDDVTFDFGKKGKTNMKARAFPIFRKGLMVLSHNFPYISINVLFSVIIGLVL